MKVLLLLLTIMSLFKSTVNESFSSDDSGKLKIDSIIGGTADIKKLFLLKPNISKKKFNEIVISYDKDLSRLVFALNKVQLAFYSLIKDDGLIIESGFLIPKLMSFNDITKRQYNINVVEKNGQFVLTIKNYGDLYKLEKPIVIFAHEQGGTFVLR